MSAQDAGNPTDAVLDQAVQWYVRRASGEMSAADTLALEHWLAAHPGHRHTWAQLLQMGERLQQRAEHLPSGTACDVLANAAPRGRRRALGRLLAVGGSLGLLWLGRDLVHEAVHPADLRTAAGERREVALSDGTRLRLNTATAVDVIFDASARRIRLREGEIEIDTGRDPATRPLWVETRDARLVPVGTRFSVRQLDTDTRLAVSEGAVDVHLTDHAQARRIDRGEQVRFDRHQIDPPETLDPTRLAWTSGMIVAANRRLDELLAEVARHRPGRLTWAPEVAGLRITGTWPLDGDDPTDRILASLARRLPVHIQRTTRYWVRVIPA